MNIVEAFRQAKDDPSLAAVHPSIGKLQWKFGHFVNIDPVEPHGSYQNLRSCRGQFSPAPLHGLSIPAEFRDFGWSVEKISEVESV